MSDRKKGFGRSVKMEISGKSRTQQSFTKECDINSIVAKATKDGYLGHVNTAPPMYADVSNVPDYQESMAIVAHAEASFAALPAEIRKKFDNNPGAMLAFMAEPKNKAEAQALGMLPKPAKPAAAIPKAAPAKPVKTPEPKAPK